MVFKAPALMLCFMISPSFAQTESVREDFIKTVRSAARVAALYPICHRSYIVDKAKTSAVTSAFLNEAFDKYGRETVDAVFRSETIKFFTESEKIGTDNWCKMQIVDFRKGGIRDLIEGL